MSPVGGSKSPALIRDNQVCFEIIREGAVYGKNHGDSKLYGEGSVFWHGSGEITVSESPSDGYYSCLVAYFEYDPGVMAEPWPSYFQWDDRLVMHRFADEMLYAYHSAALRRSVVGNLLWARLQFQLERYRQSLDREVVHPKLQLAIDFINLHYAEPISLDDVAQSADLSVSHLHMLFREHMKESPRQFLIQKRMRSAGHALVTSREPIKVIASQFGYANTENFCRAFRKFFGRSASEYRSAYIGGLNS
ncbi:AraC family transcriptional regulator [Coraliomargarita algicola]|uniref:AraC family transcriptional regulator n=1 Tax=Coraliomargarita algicola TaxID=3092156 RepID=A0ABZ0RLZ9_9BACT|nr:AraC family transcriptional regulator [Coraliomargarita sp. J2-16]WPJ96468.1 AraC family transcriptional regulator [Coraliomargarita sp. J2-16]